MIGSFSMSCRNFLTSLILSHREIPVEYRLTTCLPRAFPVFSPFSFSSRCLYSAYILLIISSLALSTLLCVHLCPNLPLSMTLFNSSRFLCCSILYSGISTTFNTPSTLAIIFIKCHNQYQNLQRGFCDAVVVHHFIFNVHFISCCVFIHIFFSTRSLTFALGFLHPILYFQPKPSRSDSRTLCFTTIPVSSCRGRLGLAWALFTHRRFLPGRGAFAGIFTCVCVYQGFFWGSSSLRFAGLHIHILGITGPAHLLV